MGHCLLCYANLTGLFPIGTKATYSISKLQDIVSRCNKYLTKDMNPTNPSINWNLQFDVDPFCEDCGVNSQQLVLLDLKLDQINAEIKQLTSRITEKILHERQNYPLLNGAAPTSFFQSEVCLPTKQGQTEMRQTATNLAEQTFDNWDLLNSNDESVYDSIQDDSLPELGRNENELKDIPEKNKRLKSRTKVTSPSKRTQSTKSVFDEKGLGKVTSSDLMLKSGTDSFACPKCNKKFARVDILKRHDCQSLTYECETCGKSFSSQGSLAIHSKIHSGVKPHECETCGKRFTLPHHLRLHLMTHTGEKPYECEICKKSFREKNYLVKHKLQHSSDENVKRKYTCDICSKSFTLYKTLKHHLVRHTGDSQFKCEACGKAFGTAAALRNHESTHSVDRPVKCSFCWKSFVSVRHLRSHEVIHKTREEFQCEICGTSYRSKNSLNVHVNLKHVNEGELICDICGKLFYSRLNLKLHKRHHDNLANSKSSGPSSKKFKCVVCERTYSQKCELKRHQTRSHIVTTLSDITCDVCQKLFEDQLDYQNHKKTRPEGRYKCDICDESYRTRCQMICHFTKNHTETDYPIKCICGRAFLGRKDFYRHKQRECSFKSGTTTKNKGSRSNKPKYSPEPGESESDEKEQSSSSKSLRRSGKVRKRNAYVEKEEPQDNEDSSDDQDYDLPNSDSDDEDEKPIQIKEENEVWIKEEPMD